MNFSQQFMKAKKNNLYAKRIIIAVKAGGSDPDVNRQLHQVLADAREAQIPKDIINRNIEKASMQKSDFKESVSQIKCTY
jgi:transcriptional/translational regulatory protein YebC/TACO1